MVEQGLPEALAQHIGFGIHQRIDERALLGLAQVQLDVAEGALQLVDHRLQRVARPRTGPRRPRRRVKGQFVGRPRPGRCRRMTERNLDGAIRAHDQDALRLNPPAQVEEEADRAEVGPLQIVQ